MTWRSVDAAPPRRLHAPESAARPMRTIRLHLARIPAVVAVAALLATMALPARPTAAQAQQATLALRGQVVDAETGAGIPDVILRIQGTEISAASDEEGRFALFRIPRGRWTLQLDHVAYGRRTHDIAVSGEGDMAAEIRLSPQAIEIEPLVVEAEGAVTRERRRTGASFWEVTRDEIEDAMGTSRHMGDLIRQTVPGIKLRQANNLSQTDICLEFRAAASISIVNQRPCNHPMVLMDGVPVSSPQSLYGSLVLNDLERIQVLPPGEASTRYGSGSLYGVLLIETRRPGVDRPQGLDALGPRSAMTTFDWSQDPRGHRTGSVLLGSAVGNALGLAAGLAIARQCIVQTDAQLRSTCSTAATAGAGAAAVLLPAVGSALGARWSGRSDRSEGRLAPALIGAGLMIFPGYAFSLATAGGSNETVNAVGSVFLTLGVPLAVTLADRLYRSVRGR